MYLKSVQIKNFRSLKDVKVELDEKSTILLGETNAGKTSCLDAIRIALTRTNGKYSFEDYDYYMDDSILSPKESEGIEVVLTFRERSEDEWDGYIMDSLGEAVQYLGSDALGSIIVKVYSQYNEATGEFETGACFLNNEYEEISARAQNKIGLFYRLCPVFYLQALRNIKDSFNSKSSVWGRFLKKANIPQEKLRELQSSIAELNKEIITNDTNLTKLVGALEEIQKVLDFQGEDLVSINALPMRSWDLLSKAQVVLSNASSVSFPLEKHGQGTQSVTTILLFKAYIDILLEQFNSEGAEAILMLEEPEAHLHPQAIRAVEKVVKGLSCQKLITTHSPYFLQNSNLLNLRLFKKKKGLTEVVQITQKIIMPLEDITASLKKVVENYSDIFELDEENNELAICKPISPQVAPAVKGCCKIPEVEEYILKSQDIFTDEELSNLNMYVQRTRGEILFARKWILYEGQTEDIIIQYCAEKLGYNIEQYGVSGIFYRTNGSAGAFVKLARVLNIDWVLLGDKDKQGNSTIKEIKKCGYSEEEVDKRVFLTHEKDIESEFVKNGFLADYEKIVADKLDDDIKKLKLDGKDDEYKNQVIKIVQKGKVEYAYKLVDEWERRGMSKEEIPVFVKEFIEEVCKNE